MFLTRAATALALGLAFTASRAEGADVLPIDQVRPGMTGVGLTVFEGSRIEEFKVSLFAQELKTPYPISEKRLKAKLKEVEHMV